MLNTAFLKLKSVISSAKTISLVCELNAALTFSLTALISSIGAYEKKVISPVFEIKFCAKQS